MLLVRCAERPESPLSATVWRGTPPPLRLGVGDVTPSFLRSMADFYCGVAAIRDRWYIIWKGASPPPLTPEVSVTRMSFRPRRAPYSAGSMELGRGGDVVFYVFAPDTSQLRGGYRLRPGVLAMVICQDLAPSQLGLVLRPTRLVLALRRPLFLCFCTST